MKIELKKKTEARGKVWYFLLINEVCEAAYHEDEFEQAKKDYELAVANNGTKEEIILSTEIKK